MLAHAKKGTSSGLYPVVANCGAERNRERPDRARASSALFSDALDVCEVSTARAAECLGVSRQLVDRKRLEQAPSLADVLLLIEGEPDAGQWLVDALQRRVNEARGHEAPPVHLLGSLVMGVGAVLGELLSAVVCGLGCERAHAEKILIKCAALHRQIGAVEACVESVR